MNRSIFLVLASALAGCAYSGPPVTWVEAVYDAPPHTVLAKVFLINRDREVGDCVLRGGSHVTLREHGRGNADLALFTRSRRAGRLMYGLTFMAADGTTLAHYPYPDGRVYVQHIPAGVRDFIGGTGFPIPDDVYDRVTRVLIHARCGPAAPPSGA